MSNPEARILQLETAVDDLPAGNSRLREERDELLRALRPLIRAASHYLLRGSMSADSGLRAIQENADAPKDLRELARATIAGRIILRQITDHQKPKK